MMGAKLKTEKTFEMLAMEKRPGIVSEFRYFLRHSKKWWLIPILVALMLMGLVVMLSSTAVAPFIYPLF